MGTGRGAKRRLDLTVSIYADNMRAKCWTVALTIAGQALRVSDQREEFIYLASRASLSHHLGQPPDEGLRAN